MKNKITIDLEFGSDFQKEVHLQILRLTLGALKISMESKHKKNKMNITDDELNKKL